MPVVTCQDCGKEFKGDKAQSACNKHFNVSPIQQHIDYLLPSIIVLVSDLQSQKEHAEFVNLFKCTFCERDPFRYEFASPNVLRQTVANVVKYFDLSQFI